MTHTLKLFALRAWLPVLLVAIWWFASRGSTSLYFPPLSQIMSIFAEDWLGRRVVSDLLPTLGKLLIGFGLSVVLGILLGVFLGLNRWARSLVEYIVLFFRSLPPPVLVPVGVVIIGIGAAMNIFIVVLGAIWPTLMGTIDGVRSLDLVQRDMAKSYRLTVWQRLMYVILPNAGPQILAGMRTTLQLSIILVVVAEMLASTNGVGHYVLASQQTFAVTETWAGTLLLGVIGYLTTLVFVSIERRVLRWQRGSGQE
ncbi:MAG: ABC transporter permease [Propionibacteriaceae bacterium]|nr:ABC transporter permease [Propionibacteriaceae bacterium]